MTNTIIISSLDVERLAHAPNQGIDASKRNFLLRQVPSAALAVSLGTGFHQQAQAFALPLLFAKLFVGLGFIRAGVEIFKTRSYRENVSGLGSAGSYEAEPRLMISGGNRFENPRWKIDAIEAHAIESKRLYDGEKVFPIDTTVSMSDQRDIDIYNRALERFKLTPLRGSPQYSKRAVESEKGAGYIMAADRTRIVDAQGNHLETILPVVVAMRGQEPQLFPIREKG